MRGTLLLDRGIDRRTLLLGIGAGTGLVVARHGQPTLARQATPGAEDAEAIVGDVVDFTLAPEGRWPGPFSSVTLRLHPGFFDGGDAWFIRTDTSDAEFAEQEGLVYVPLLRNALEAEGSFADLYRIAGGVDSQHPVLSATPAQKGYSPAFRLHDVAFAGEPELLDSVAAIGGRRGRPRHRHAAGRRRQLPAGGLARRRAGGRPGPGNAARRRPPRRRT